MPPNSDLNNIEPHAGKSNQSVRTAGTGRLGTRLLRDKAAFTTLVYATAGFVLVLAGLAAFRTIAGVVASVVYRVHLLLSLPLH